MATVPDATTVLNFRHWLEEHDLTRALFDEVGAMLEERGLLMRQGTIVDATIIAAPPSTKNKSKARDPEMHQTKKGNQWHFGMKAHIGVDVASGVVHTVVGTAANEADINQTAALLHLAGRGTHGLLQLYRGLLQSHPAPFSPGVSLAHLLRTGDANRPTVRHPLNRPPKRGNFNQPTFAATILAMETHHRPAAPRCWPMPALPAAKRWPRRSSSRAHCQHPAAVAIARTQPRPYDFRPPPKPKPERRIREPWRLAMKAKLESEEGKARYRKRQQTVEPVFGIIKSAIGFTRFHLPRPRKRSPPSGSSSRSPITAAASAACTRPEPTAPPNPNQIENPTRG